MGLMSRVARRKGAPTRPASAFVRDSRSMLGRRLRKQQARAYSKALTCCRKGSNKCNLEAQRSWFENSCDTDCRWRKKPELHTDCGFDSVWPP